MHSDHAKPLNIGTDVLVTVDELIDLVAEAAGKRIGKRYDPSKPQGVRGRNSDNARLRHVLEWEPAVSLSEGLGATYGWIEGELSKQGRL